MLVGDPLIETVGLGGTAWFGVWEVVFLTVVVGVVGEEVDLLDDEVVLGTVEDDENGVSFMWIYKFKNIISNTRYTNYKNCKY